MYRDGVTQDQLERDRARFDKPEPVAAAPAPAAAAKRGRPSVELNRRTSFALPKNDITAFTFAPNGWCLRVSGRESYLTFLNGDYQQLQEQVYSRLVFKSRFVYHPSSLLFLVTKQRPT